MRRAAAKLGFGFGEKISIASRRSQFTRRSYSKLLAAADVSKKIGFEGMESGSEKELKLKSLNLCFTEYNHHENSFSQVVRPIKLRSIIEKEGEEVECLSEADCERSTVDTVCCGLLPNRFGSQITYPRTKENSSVTRISCIDTSTKKITTSSCTFHSPILDSLLLGYLQGKVYCIHPGNISRPFQVFHSTWFHLPYPPVKNLMAMEASFLDDTKTILLWELNKTGVYFFDISRPTAWTYSFNSLDVALPFLRNKYGRPPVFFSDHHPVLGTFYLMFHYDHIHSLVTPFFLSCFHQIFQSNMPFQLPYTCDGFNDFEFVHLGDQKVCLVLYKLLSSFLHDPAHIRGDTENILLITFEYEIITRIIDTKTTAQIQTRFLRARRFRYCSNHVHTSVRMTGVFLQ